MKKQKSYVASFMQEPSFIVGIRAASLKEATKKACDKANKNGWEFVDIYEVEVK